LHLLLLFFTYAVRLLVIIGVLAFQVVSDHKLHSICVIIDVKGWGIRTAAPLLFLFRIQIPFNHAHLVLLRLLFLVPDNLVFQTQVSRYELGLHSHVNHFLQLLWVLVLLQNTTHQYLVIIAFLLGHINHVSLDVRKGHQYILEYFS